MRAHMRFITRITLHRYASAYALAIILSMAASPAGAENYVGNGRFVERREGPGPWFVPASGKWFPESWQVTPGPGTATVSVPAIPATVSDGYGRQIYVQFTDYDPFPEPGRAWLITHIAEFDTMMGQTLTVSWWQKIDGCCIGVVPMLMVNYHNGDYQFWAAGGYFLADQSDVIWPQQLAKDPAGYRALLKGAPYCLATTQWHECTLTFVLPDGAGHTVNNTRRVDLAFNFRSRTAAGIHIAHVRLEVDQ